MKINFFKKTLLFVSLSTLFLLSGCQEKPPAEDQIIADMPGELTEIFVDDVPIGMSIDNIEITRRQTNEKDDTVYFKYEMSGGPYCVTGSYRFDYVYYDQGGWILDDYAINSEPEIRVLQTESFDNILDSLEELAYIELADKYDMIECVNRSVTEQNVYIAHQVLKDSLCRSDSGYIHSTFTLQANNWPNYTWSSDFYYDDVVATWNILGSWLLDRERFPHYSKPHSNISFTIDSMDSESLAIHIPKLTVENTSDWNGFEVTKTDLTLYPDKRSSSNKLWYSFTYEDTYGKTTDALVFSKDKAEWSIGVNLYPLGRKS